MGGWSRDLSVLVALVCFVRLTQARVMKLGRGSSTKKIPLLLIMIIDVEGPVLQGDPLGWGS